MLVAFVPGVAKTQESPHLCTGLCLISLLILFPKSLIAITPEANVTHTTEASAETDKYQQTRYTRLSKTLLL
ncbi:hypothetical protein BDP27DRAFT_1321991 [Rhodocollybia butyracea]|uniref:Uncharacterized protein n=1 Tax=Rhodocollybia butyracea TaxID=206335 RepID=A0A9P5U921_9AGAR|nr:hypothetical protein BDP27DRAFT_1321991 [Rhodocollybia butyracea]